MSELFPEFEWKFVENAVERVKNALEFSNHLGMGKLYVAFSGGKGNGL